MTDTIIDSEYLLPAVNSDVSPNISELFKDGMTSFRHKDYSGAVVAFQNVINANPELPEAHVNLGNAYFLRNKINEAIECWQKALSLDSTQVSCYLNIGNAYFVNGNVPEAIKHWLTVITMAPDHPTANINLGAAYEQLGDLSQAFKYYEEYLKYHAKDKTADYQKIYVKVAKSKKVAMNNLNAGVYYQKRNKLRKAAICYLRSIRVYPNFPKAHLNMGSICYIAKRYNHAIKYWINAVKLDPTFDNTYCNLGIAYDIMKKYDLAYCMYTKFLEMNKRGSARIEERLDVLKKHFGKHPEEINKHLEKAENFYNKQKFADALWEYENYVILKTDKKSSLEARINEIKGYLNPVIKAANTAYEIGNKCFEQGKYDKATQAYRRYLLLNPEGEFKKIVRKKISDCAKQMGKSLSAFAKADRIN